ncbi:MAG: FecR family protein [Chitinophagaceae bacterium]|nr:FecR family protein [Chitinophagaceae bacterium]
MKQTPLSVEELVMNESFVNYCYYSDQYDIQYWENYLLVFPDQKAYLEEAKNIVLGLSGMFLQQQQELALTALKNTVDQKYHFRDEAGLTAYNDVLPVRPMPAKKIWAYLAAAVCIGFGFFFVLQFSGSRQVNAPVAPATTQPQQSLVYETNYGEKKTIWLPDSSKVILNARSTLRTRADFGVSAREVYLTGEAFFDVTHNAQKPFVVNMNQFEVKVLGTLFNIKAYPEDKLQEASLIRGKVQVIFKNGENNSIFLNPNEKAIIPNKEGDAIPRKAEGIQKINQLTPTVTALTINNKDNSIIETSWVYDRLDIYDKTFSQIRTDLERRYNVHIDFKDKKVANYRFSATFEKETIEQILKALQLSYPFHYSIDENNTITISK